MKNLNLFFLPLALTILIITPIIIQAQDISGDGNVVRETRSIGSFDEIQTEGVISIYLTQGDYESIVVETDKNLQFLVQTFVNDNTLIIKNRDDANIEKSTKMNVYVTLRDLDELKMSGVGKVETLNQLNLDNLEIEDSGVGNTILNLKCKKLKADINSVGNLTLKGEVTNVSIDHNGTGNIKAEDLSAEILRIQSNGVGNAEVNSSKEIYINLNGIGNVTYKGNAVVKEMNINGMGKVTKM